MTNNALMHNLRLMQSLRNHGRNKLLDRLIETLIDQIESDDQRLNSQHAQNWQAQEDAA